MPNFTDPEEASKYLINRFEDIIKSIETAPNHEEKAKIMKEFDMSQFKAEDSLLNGKPVKDYEEYQRAKQLVYDFFNWIEKQKGVNVFKASHNDPFFNEMQGNKTLSVAMLIQTLPILPVELQAYIMLNIFRTTYELNFKNLTLILHESLKKQQKKTFDFYKLKTFKEEFKDYPRIERVMYYFKNDIRNPIAHEDWFVKNGWVLTKNKGQEQKQDMMELSRQIYELFFFRVALSTYLLEKYRDFAKSIQVTPQMVNKFISELKIKIEELKAKENNI